jgi:2-amino-4-hydroxy-6-hydroxymethyldihydropteridine diphosphokinase
MNGLRTTSMEKNETSKLLLSLGSNMNDKKSHLELAIIKIEELIGCIEKRSSVYESPSWGFDSDSFYNQSILCETSLDVFKCLKLIKQIEQDLGRTTKSIDQVYQNRPIDIDIIFNDQLIIQSDELTIPHFLFHKRRFVLAPTKEIIPNFYPPGFNKNIAELLDSCEDKSNCTLVE